MYIGGGGEGGLGGGLGHGGGGDGDGGGGGGEGGGAGGGFGGGGGEGKVLEAMVAHTSQPDRTTEPSEYQVKVSPGDMAIGPFACICIGDVPESRPRPQLRLPQLR